MYAKLDARKKNGVQAKIAARGYHVYKNLAQSSDKQGDFVTMEIETDKES